MQVNEYLSQVISLRVVLISIFLAIILSASSTYLALKIGILPSASIPAALLAMTILRLFKNSTIHETNLIQTAASAGEAVAGGIVFIIPALIIMHYWTHFPYLENVAIAFLGGLLGLLFSIPLRRILINSPQLYFPEAKAIAEVLQLTKQKALRIQEMLMGAGLGALLELAQGGLKLISASVEKWWTIGQHTVVGFGIGFSPALIGVGYLVGFDVGLSLFLGALLTWGIGLPLLSYFSLSPTVDMAALRTDLHYIGLGAIIVAGLWTLLCLIKPFYLSLKVSLQGLAAKRSQVQTITLNETDISGTYLLGGLIFFILAAAYLFLQLFPSSLFNAVSTWELFIIVALLYMLLMGFCFAIICGYFSGLVGVTASPGSAVVISGILLIALILRGMLAWQGHASAAQLFNAAGATVIVGAIVAGAACISNDNIQDLKVGHLIGTIPRQQQIMLFIGVIVASMIVPLVMDLLFHAYGLVNVLPHPGMDSAQTLSAPPAAMMAGLTQGVFNHDLPWSLLGIGALIMGGCILIKLSGIKKLSLLGVGMGIYLPLSSSIPLFLGSLFAFLIKKRFISHLSHANDDCKSHLKQRQHGAVILACGLVAGSALMDVLLAIPLSITGNNNFLAILPQQWQGIAQLLGFISAFTLGYIFYRVNFKK